MPERYQRLVVVVTLIGVAACAPPASTEGAAPAAVSQEVVGNEIASDRLVVVRDPPEAASDEELRDASARGEELLDRIVAFVGTQHAPDRRLTVRLEGDARTDEPGAMTRDGYRVPYVDGTGVVHLYRYTEGYFSAYGHELVHAVRLATGHWKGGFFEEGFASLIGDSVQPDRQGYPRYGVPPVVAAGQWLARGESLPMRALMDRHRELNLRCMAQSYTQRASFFRYLDATHGRATMLALAHDRRPFDGTAFETNFGASLETVQAAWQVDLLARFRAFEGSDELAEHYRTQTPVRFWPPCSAAR